MRLKQRLLTATALATLASSALASAVVGDAEITPAPVPDSEMIAPPQDYALGTEMVVHDWVLCTSEKAARSLIFARAKSVISARVMYGHFADTRQCGQFSDLRVKLVSTLSVTDPVPHVQLFRANIRLGDGWGFGFVVTDEVLSGSE